MMNNKNIDKEVKELKKAMIKMLGNSYKVGLEVKKQETKYKISNKLEEIHYKINSTEESVDLLFKGNTAKRSKEILKERVYQLDKLIN